MRFRRRPGRGPPGSLPRYHRRAGRRRRGHADRRLQLGQLQQLELRHDVHQLGPGRRADHHRRGPHLQQHGLLGRLHQLRDPVRPAAAHQADRPAARRGQREPAEHPDREPGQRGRQGDHREPGDRDQPGPGHQLRGRAPRTAGVRRHHRRRRQGVHGGARVQHELRTGRLRPHQLQGQVRLRARPRGRPDLVQRRRPDQRLRLLHGGERPVRAHPQGPDGLDRSAPR